ncbi:MAG: DUF1257 domain-containing protein [Pirellulales bacterium]|nr:DUF1257 domain-containing protein [Pirellulales bacterium]
MSHIVTINTQVRDRAAVEAAARRLQLSPPAEETVRLFSGTVTGLALRLPGWKFPLVCDLADGQLHFDNYEGHWGKRRELDRFLQAYAVEKARLEAHRRGHRVFEQPLADGSIKLTIQVAGGTA